MKNYLLSILALAIICFASEVTAQTQGKITQEITMVSSDDEQMAMALEMMKGTQTEYFYNGKMSLVKSSTMGGMVENKVLIDNTSKEVVMLINAMGQKMMVETSTADFESAGGDQAEIMKEVEITYDESDTKEILGHKCIKASVKHPEMDEVATFTMYVAKDLKLDNRMIQDMQAFEIEGFPLEYTMDMKGANMTMTITTIAIEDKIDEKVFNVDKSGYKKMTLDELMQMSGGMGM